MEAGDTGDRVVLSTPRGTLGISAMRVVIGWMASCHDLPLDRLDDLQLALETVLAEELEEGCALSLTVYVEAGVLHAIIEGLVNPGLRAAVVADRPFQPSTECLLDVRLFLDALLDHYQLLDMSPRTFGIHMQKRIA
jgi:hypothetical protein